ncbi:MAG: dihydroxy-acid dehydratase, partial [Acetobacteraceae bacterium]
FNQDVIRTVADPIYASGGIAVLRGNLAPGGAIIKQSAADPKLMEHESRAVVFENIDDMARRMDDPDLDVRADDILVLKRIGPKGAPGMPEAGYVPIPRKLARAGVKDMVRISDGRMSGTAAGTIVLHVTPESAVGGPLAHVRNGDRIRLSVARRELTLLVDETELARRAAAAPVVPPNRRSRSPEAVPAKRAAGRPGRGLRFPEARRPQTLRTALDRYPPTLMRFPRQRRSWRHRRRVTKALSAPFLGGRGWGEVGAGNTMWGPCDATALIQPTLTLTLVNATDQGAAPLGQAPGL